MYNNGSTSITYSPAPPQPAQPELLITKACNLNDGLRELNDRLATLRASLFGEGENAPVADKRGQLPLAGYLSESMAFLEQAFNQVASIQNRI